MSNEKPIIIVGAGLAGTYAAETLRKDGYQGRIILLDKGKEMPYDRPPLSKEYMVGEATESDMVLFSPSRSEEHTSELQSRGHIVCRLLLEKIKVSIQIHIRFIKIHNR